MRYSLEDLQKMTEVERQHCCRNAERDRPTVVGMIADAKRREDLEYAHQLQADLENTEETIRNCEKLKQSLPPEP